ncbi:MAG: hypothetical protein ACRDUA_08840 [Micromonosporaceae bacterium]
MSEHPHQKPPKRRKSRREKIADEIEANRRGEYAVPTWVLFLALVAMIAGLVLLVVVAG